MDMSISLETQRGLSVCFNYDSIEATLDSLGVESDIAIRLDRLNKHLGVSQVYGCSEDAEGLTKKDHYEFAKRQLVWENNQRLTT